MMPTSRFFTTAISFGIYFCVFILFVCHNRAHAQSNTQQISNSPNAIQINTSGNGIHKIYIPNDPKLEKLFNKKFELAELSRGKQLDSIKKILLPFYRENQRQHELLKNAINKLGDRFSDGISLIDVSLRYIRDDIANLSLMNEQNADSMLAKFEMTSIVLLDISKKIDNLGIKIDAILGVVVLERQRKIEERQKRVDDFRAGKPAVFKSFSLSVGQSLVRFSVPGININQEPGFALGAGFSIIPRYRFRRVLNPDISLHVNYGSFFTSRNGLRFDRLRFAWSDLQVGTNCQVHLSSLKKSIYTLIIPLKLAIAYNFYHRYESLLTNYSNSQINAQNNNTDIQRINPVMLGLSTGFGWQLLAKEHKGGVRIGFDFGFYFTDYYRQSFADSDNYKPFDQLTSRLCFGKANLTYVFN